jgi:large subunit ribosomal protein L4
MVSVLETLKVADKKVLLVVKEFDDNLILASRNLQNVVLILADEINVLDIVGTDVMVATEDAIKYIEEVLK